MKEIFRPEWTCGRFHNSGDKNYALVYNLIEGMAYFFEEESALLIRTILRFPRNGQVPIQALLAACDGQFSESEINEFCAELINVGVLSEGILSVEKTKEIRNIIGLNRKVRSQETQKTVQERLPFLQDDAENTYMDLIEKDRIPFVVMLELTYNCNEKCIHCFNPGASRNDEERSLRNDRQEIGLDSYEKLFDELKELGVVKVILTGGDPFVKKDIWKMIELLYERDFAIDIYTNGLALLGKEEKLAKFYPKSIGLSVYSADESVHDGITRVKNSLKKTLLVAENFVKYAVPLFFKCPIMYHNSTSYFTVANLAKEFGAVAQIDITLTDAVDGDTSITENLHVDGELLEIILRDPNIPLYVGSEAPNFGRVDRDRSQSFCGAGTVLMNITPEGDVTPCNSFPTQFGNLKDKTFQEIWQSSSSLREWQKTTISDYEECGTHDRCGYCNRCPGMSFIEHGTPLKASSSNCRNATARMNLANSLKAGIDPLKGMNVEDRLLQMELPSKVIVSKKPSSNFRNVELNIKK
jgi:radical SAM protein with 4Fe4S-binding SPASM domain